MSTEGNTPQREVVNTNWDALTNAYEGMSLTEPKKEEPAAKPEEKPVEQVIPDENKPEGDKPAAEEVKTPEQEAESLKAEAKELGLPENATKEDVEAAKIEKENASKPIIEFKLEDIVGNEKEPEDGSWMAVAKAAGVEIKEDSFDSLKEAIIAPFVKQIEDTKALTIENLFSTMKPETVAAFKLLEMGIPEQQLFHPTQQIDEYLKLGDSELVRADKEALGWKPEMVEAELELLAEKKLLGHEAEKLRLMLNGSKENILKQRESYIQQYEGKKQEAILHQKEHEKEHFTKAMNTVSTFMGAPIPADVKEAIIKKYANGAYDNELNTPASKVEYILQKELGQKVLKTLVNTAEQKGRDTVRTKLLAIPPVTGNNAGQTQTQVKSDDPWAALEKMVAGG